MIAALVDIWGRKGIKHDISISCHTSLMARFLVLIDGYFRLLFPLVRSVSLVNLINFYLVDIKYSGIGKSYYIDKCLDYALIIPAGSLVGKVFGADC